MASEPRLRLVRLDSLAQPKEGLLASTPASQIAEVQSDGDLA